MRWWWRFAERSGRPTAVTDDETVEALLQFVNERKETFQRIVQRSLEVLIDKIDSGDPGDKLHFRCDSAGGHGNARSPGAVDLNKALGHGVKWVEDLQEPDARCMGWRSRSSYRRARTRSTARQRRHRGYQGVGRRWRGHREALSCLDGQLPGHDPRRGGERP